MAGGDEWSGQWAVRKVEWSGAELWAWMRGVGLRRGCGCKSVCVCVSVFVSVSVCGCAFALGVGAGVGVNVCV